MTNHGMIARAASVAALLAALSAVASSQQPEHAVIPGDPDVSVNIRNENIPARRTIDFTATPGTYVTVIRVNPLGNVEVLYPASAVVDKAMIPSRRRVPVPKTPTTTNPAGIGSIYAFVSRTPYVFSKVADANGWNSLHLANYADATDEAIAESFGNEIAAPNARVIMSRATTAPVAIIAHDHRPTVGRLASFKNKTCLGTTYAVTNGNGSTSCVTFFLPGQPVPMQNTTPAQAPAPTPPPVKNK